MYIRMFAVLVGLMLIPAYFLSPPLSVRPPEEQVNYAATRFLSEPAQAGQTAFGERCAQCHGAIADGAGGAPGLTDQDYAVDFRNAPAFHGAVGRDIPEHRAVLGAARAEGRLSFNELELMAKYLRELRIKKQRDAENE